MVYVIKEHVYTDKAVTRENTSFLLRRSPFAQ